MKSTSNSALPSLLALLFALVISHPVAAVDVNFMAVYKNQVFEQNNPFVATLREASHSDTNRMPVKFGVFISPTGLSSVTTATFDHPNGSGITVPTSENGERSLERGFEFLPALDAEYADGNYTIHVTGANDGNQTVTVTLSGDTYPSTPRVANWTDAQAVDPAASFMLQWDALIGGTTADIIMVEVRSQSEQGGTLFESPGPGAPGQLDGTSTSVSIPAGTLTAGTTYEALIRFIRATDNEMTYASTLAGYMKETLFTLRTTGGTDTQPPSLEVSRPPHGTTNVRDISSVVFRFREPMDTSVDPAQAIAWTGLTPSGFSYRWSTDGRELFCRYTPSLPLGSTISWTLNPDGSTAKLKDIAQNDLANNFYGEFSTASGSNVGDPDVGFLSVIKAQGFVQTNNTPVDLKRWVFELETELGGFGTLTNASLSTVLGGPALYETEFDGDTMSIEAAYNSQADLDAFFPSSSAYTNDFGGYQDGVQRIVLDFPADNYPNTPTLQGFSALSAVDPDQDLQLTWIGMTSPATDDFIMVEIQNSGHQTLFETPGPGDAGLLTGTATGVTIPAGTLPPGRTFEAELNFVKVVEKDTSSYPNVLGLAAFVKQTRFQITTTGTPVVPSIENPVYNSGNFSFRVRGEYLGAYTIESAMSVTNFSTFFSGTAHTQSTNGTGIFDVSVPIGSELQFYRALEGYPQSSGGQP